jgi:tetratricopeptide (TPR) repeat protein
MISGKIGRDRIPVILKDISRLNLTGILKVNEIGVVRIVAISRGEIKYVRSSDENERIGCELIRGGFVSECDVELAMTQTKNIRKLGIVLERMGFVERSVLQECLKKLFYRILTRLLLMDDGQYEFIEKDRIIVNEMPAMPNTYKIILHILRNVDIDHKIIEMILGENYKISCERDIENILSKVELNEEEQDVLHILKRNGNQGTINLTLGVNLVKKVWIIYRLYCLGIINLFDISNEKRQFLIRLHNLIKEGDYYKLLGCKDGDSNEQITVKYEQLMRLVKEKVEEGDKFELHAYRNLVQDGIDKAYRVLMHKMSREAYDEILKQVRRNESNIILLTDESGCGTESELKKKREAYVYYQKALRMEEKGLIAEKIKLMEKACLLDEKNEFYLYKLASSLIFEKSSERDGEKLMLKVLKMNPYNAEAWFILYKFYKKSGLICKANECLARAINIDSRYRKYIEDGNIIKDKKEEKVFNLKFMFVILIYIIIFICWCLIGNKEEVPLPPFMISGVR